MKRNRARKSISFFLVFVLIFTLFVPIGAVAAEENNELLLPASNDVKNSTSLFSDLTEDERYSLFVNYLYHRGLLNGFPDGTFRPEEGFTRAQAAHIIARSAGLPLISSASLPFSDLYADHWAYSAIATAYEHGLLQGFEDGTFRPDDPLTRAQALALILRLEEESYIEDEDLPSLLYNDISPEHWAKKDLAIALEAGLLRKPHKDEGLEPEKPFSRIELSRALSMVMTKGPTVSTAPLALTLEVTEGTAKIVRANGVSQETSGKATLRFGDTIHMDGRGEINFDDGSGLLLLPGSVLVLKEGKGRSYIKQNGEPGTAVEWLHIEVPQGSVFGVIASYYFLEQLYPSLGSSDLAKLTQEKMAQEKPFHAVLSQTVSADAVAKSSVELVGDFAGQEIELTLIAENIGSQVLDEVTSAQDRLRSGDENNKASWWQKLKQKRTRVQVDTPWSVAAVQGTWWQTAIDSVDSGTVSVLYGEVLLSSNRGVDVIYSEQEVNKQEAQSPLAPAPFSDETLLAWDGVRSWLDTRLEAIIDNMPDTRAIEPEQDIKQEVFQDAYREIVQKIIDSYAENVAVLAQEQKDNDLQITPTTPRSGGGRSNPPNTNNPTNPVDNGVNPVNPGPDNSYRFNEPFTVKATLYDSTNRPLANKSLHLEFVQGYNSTVLDETTLRTDSLGRVSWTIRPQLDLSESYRVQATFEGDGNYYFSEASRSVDFQWPHNYRPYYKVDINANLSVSEAVYTEKVIATVETTYQDYNYEREAVSGYAPYQDVYVGLYHRYTENPVFEVVGNVNKAVSATLTTDQDGKAQWELPSLPIGEYELVFTPRSYVGEFVEEREYLSIVGNSRFRIENEEFLYGSITSNPSDKFQLSGILEYYNGSSWQAIRNSDVSITVDRWPKQGEQNSSERFSETLTTSNEGRFSYELDLASVANLSSNIFYVHYIYSGDNSYEGVDVTEAVTYRPLYVGYNYIKQTDSEIVHASEAGAPLALYFTWQVKDAQGESPVVNGEIRYAIRDDNTSEPYERFTIYSDLEGNFSIPIPEQPGRYYVNLEPVRPGNNFMEPTIEVGLNNDMYVRNNFHVNNGTVDLYINNYILGSNSISAWLYYHESSRYDYAPLTGQEVIFMLEQPDQSWVEIGKATTTSSGEAKLVITEELINTHQLDRNRPYNLEALFIGNNRYASSFDELNNLRFSNTYITIEPIRIVIGTGDSGSEETGDSGGEETNDSGSGGIGDSNTARGSINIISVTPDVATAGENTSFQVEIAYSFEGMERASLNVGFNTTNLNTYRMFGSFKTSEKSGFHTFDVTDIPVKDWGDEGSFQVYVNILEDIVTDYWTVIAFDKGDINVTSP
ncbi:S-layer homology domain-containing protein [Heliorestis acidaminivorans]|nr:S-layer homology domain-containing protein [Heliorestis acidaminivorans]